MLVSFHRKPMWCGKENQGRSRTTYSLPRVGPVLAKHEPLSSLDPSVPFNTYALFSKEENQYLKDFK